MFAFANHTASYSHRTQAIVDREGRENNTEACLKLIGQKSPTTLAQAKV